MTLPKIDNHAPDITNQVKAVAPQNDTFVKIDEFQLLLEKNANKYDLPTAGVPAYRIISDLFKNIAGNIAMRFIQEHMGSVDPSRKDLQIAREKTVDSFVDAQRTIEHLENEKASLRFLAEIERISEKSPFQQREPSAFVRNPYNGKDSKS